MATLFRTALAKAGVGTLVAMTFGRTKRNALGVEEEERLVLDNGTAERTCPLVGVGERPRRLWVRVVAHPVVGVHDLAPFHQYWALPWNLLVPDLVT